MICNCVIEVLDVLKIFNDTAAMDRVSTIGVARHNGTQVPWETDTDITFLVDTDAVAYEFYPGNHPPLIFCNRE